MQITGAIREGSMRRRQALIIELQERVRRIQTEIEKEQEKIEEIEYNIHRKREDLEFHLTLLHELEVQETTIETSETTEVKVETRLADSERSPAKLTREQYLEQKERARVWNLNREREAQAKSRRR